MFLVRDVAPHTVGVWMKDLFAPRFGLLPLELGLSVAPNRLRWVMRVFLTVKLRCRCEHPVVTDSSPSFSHVES